MTVDELQQSTSSDSTPPEGLSEELQALWHTKAGDWESAHNIAQDIPTKMGSWIHAHLHLIEGDLGNAGYWYRRADRPVRVPDQVEEEWVELVEAAIAMR